MSVGTVKSFRTSCGCGFITSPEGDVFVHFSNILENVGVPTDILVPGELVHYELISARRGRAAVRVQRLAPVQCIEKTGLVNRIFEPKGFGFIESPDGDVFFHCADVLFEGIQIGDSVQYLLANTDDNQRALKIKRTKKDA